jgi:hypothetical protein
MRIQSMAVGDTLRINRLVISHIMAWGHDHEIVRALEMNRKALPWKFETLFWVVTSFQV